MKILYVGTAHQNAQAVAAAVSGLGAGVTVSWASQLRQVTQWIDESSGPRALVVEAQPGVPLWRSVLTHAAALPYAIPIVVILPDGIAPEVQPVGLNAPEFMARGRSLARDLPAAITRAIEKLVEIERAMRVDLEQKVAQASAAVQDLERRHATAIAAAAEQQARDRSQYQIDLARATAARDMANEQFREAAIEVERVRQSHASAVANAERLAEREAELTSLLGAATASQGVLERRFADAESALREGEARAAAEQRRVTELLAEHQRDFQRKVSEETDRRRGVEERLAHALSAGDAAEVRHALAMSAATAQSLELQAALSAARQSLESKAAHLDRLTNREADLTSQLAAAAESQETIGYRLAATEAALREADAGMRREAMAGEQSAAREAVLEEQLRAERAARTALEQDLVGAGTALDDVRCEYQSAAANVARLTEREAVLVSELADADAARRDERERHDAALATAAGELTERQACFDRERADLTAQLRAVETDRDQARSEHQSVVADLARLSQRQTDLDERLEEERATRHDLEQAVADAAARLQEEQQRHRAALATAAGELADRQALFDHERADLTAQLRAVETDRDQARSEHQSVAADLARLSQRQTDLDERLEEERATRHDLEQAVADAAAGLQEEQQRHRAALATAAGELADRQALFDRERTDLTAQLRAIEADRDQARGDHQSAAAEVARLVACVAELTSKLAAAQDGQRTLELLLTEADREGTSAAERAAADSEAAAARQADLEVQVSQARETIQSLQQALVEARASALDTERHFQEEIVALRAAALTQAAQFDDCFDEQRRQYESRVADATSVTDKLTREHVALQEVLQATEAESQRLDREHQSERERLDQAHTAASAAIARLMGERHEIERRFEEERSGFQGSLDGLTRELDQRQADNHRLFQQATLPMFRCTKDGALAHANRALTTLVGRRSPDELRGAEFARAVFESPDDLSWLIERCLGSRGKESTETTWRRKDGSRLLVRVSACATSADLIEFGVEDLTPVRVLQDRLSQAHRMEAVGRLAAEVAVTCGNLLRGVQQNAEQWLLTNGSDTASRQHGEVLLEEMSRAAGLLTQLAAYGDQESRRPAVAELGAVVRGIAPVLRRVAGDAVKVQLPAASAPLNVDAGAERVERLLVNLAAYGRERMTSGGQLKIELGTIVVDRHFTDKHPNVRLGPHALVTVTESRRTTQADRLLQLPGTEAGRESQTTVAVPASVDLGTLQELVGECGGHLWMTVQPPGDMVVKIRLPLRTSYDEPPQRTLVPDRVRAIASWFQH